MVQDRKAQAFSVYMRLLAEQAADAIDSVEEASALCPRLNVGQPPTTVRAKYEAAQRARRINATEPR